MKVLGISAFVHDSAAALVIDNQVVAAAEEERFNRQKHTGDFPGQAIQYCLNEAGLEPNQLDKIAYYLAARPDFPQSYIDVLKVLASWAVKHPFAYKNGIIHLMKNPGSVIGMLNNSGEYSTSICANFRLTSCKIENFIISTISSLFSSGTAIKSFSVTDSHKSGVNLSPIVSYNV